MELLMVRHGEAGSNVDIENGIVGSDKPLTPEGVRQVKATAAFLGRIVTAHEVYSSPYRRTRETSEIIAEKLRLDIIYDDRLKEISKGDWHGRPVPEIMQIEGDIPEEEKPTFRPPNGENWQDVGARMLSLITSLADQSERQRLLVSHNHPIQMAIGALLQKPLERWEEVSVDYASVTSMQKVDGIWQLTGGLVNVRPYEQPPLRSV